MAAPFRMALCRRLPPCVLYEDEDLVVVNKPPGWNTHSPAPFAGEGIYDWLRHREPRWATLGIAHRLDKETSGLIVFGLSPRANKSLAAQFEGRTVGKRYLCATDHPVDRTEFSVESALVRAGDRYVARPLAAGGLRAETRFRVLRSEGTRSWMEAEPVTGRTHQIRVHASNSGFPLIGDRLYGGSDAPRMALHSGWLAIDHPADGRRMEWSAPVDFSIPAAESLRSAVISPEETNAWRFCHGAADGRPGWYADQLGDAWLVQNGASETVSQVPEWLLQRARNQPGDGPGLYWKRLRRDVRATTPDEAGPEWVQGPKAPEPFLMRENGVQYELSFESGYSVGLFLDQRDNRRRLLTGHVAADFSLSPGTEVLNTFAYTCGFSVCAALAGCRTTSLDLSKKYLDWGRRNFVRNGLDPTAHDFIYGDTLDWLQRMARKQREFGLIILDPPTFSRSRERGDFRAERDYGRLVGAALRVLAPRGVLLASTNAARLEPEAFLSEIRNTVGIGGRSVRQEHYVPQPIDFPITREEPAHLKTVWMRID